jgi:glutamine cyclotransferase
VRLKDEDQMKEDHQMRKRHSNPPGSFVSRNFRQRNGNKNLACFHSPANFSPDFIPRFLQSSAIWLPLVALLFLLTESVGCRREGTTATVPVPAPASAPTPAATPAPSPSSNPATDDTSTNIPVPPDGVVKYTYTVVHSYPHDPNAFTQGLLFDDGKLLESTGLTNQSTLREDELDTGKVLRKVPVPGTFAEGLALLDGKLYQLTWKGGIGYIYDEKSFNKIGDFPYTGEGWGLTTDGHWLILSDGTSQIRFLDPATFKVDHTINVTLRGAPQESLNELEYVKGEIFANIWQTDYIARIDPKTGKITGMIDFGWLLPLADKTQPTDVLNGIAYDPATDRLFVTGKLWPKIFEVKLKPKAN